MIKIAGWNVNSLKVRLPHVAEWLASQKPDVLALQETKLTDENFPAESIRELGYHVLFSGQKTYNGVAIISRKPGKDCVTDIPHLDDPQRRILAATYDDIRVINLYVPNGQALDSEKFTYKMHWLNRVTDYVKNQLEQYQKLVILGDFNIAPEDRDVHDPEEWRDQIHCSKPERAAFQALLNLGLQDSFRLFEQEEKSYSWWDYRAAAFRRNRGLRIDHILLSRALATVCKASIIDKAPRKLERPSDHAPVMASFELG